MTLRAHFDGKAFIPDEPVDLPSGASVRLTIVAELRQSPLRGLAELAKECPITNAPPDWSEQHDHYVHGTPKR